MNPLVIFMAGPPAAGKSEMAYYLSGRLGLPIFSTDSVRHDVKVQTDETDINKVLKQFETERQSASGHMFDAKRSFIYDGSVDRRWPELKKQAEAADFDWLLIDFDLSKDRITKNRKMFDRTESDTMFDKWLADHQKFHETHDSDAQLHITDDNYAERYELATNLVKKHLNR